MLARRFFADTKANFAMMFALVAPVLVLSVGMAVDVSMIARSKTTMQSALDAAVLAASRLRDANQTRDEVFEDFLAANLVGETMLYDVDAQLSVDNGLNYIQTHATATAKVRLSFMHFAPGADEVTVQASAFESTNELEVALVLDNTGSMGADNMKALREAATAMVDILQNAKTENRMVRAALVPFVATVNIKGEGYSESWIDTKAKAPLHGANFVKKPDGTPYNHLAMFTQLGVAWKGCVEARPAPYNLSDAAPDPYDPATLFVPAFAPDNPGKAEKSPNLGNGWNNSYLGDGFGTADSAKKKDVGRYFASGTAKYIDEKGPRSTGPNYACATPITPLTDDFAKLRASIASMIYWEGGGTNVSEGLAWGQRVLSPGEPYTQGKPFKSDGVSKVVVVFTDGENTVFGADNNSITYNTSDYGAYGFLDTGRMGTTNRDTALTKVNTMTKTMCESLKGQDVEIFTVVLKSLNEANRKLYSECASSPENFYPSKDVTELKDAFRKIGTAVAKLSLTQ